MKKIVTLLLVAFMALSLVGCGRSSEFGVVDMSRIQQESEFYKGINKELQEKTQKIQKEMMQIANSKKDQKELEKMINKKSGEMRLVQASARTKWENGFNAAINAVATEKELGAILYKSAAAQGGIDVTNDVLNKMDKK